MLKELNKENIYYKIVYFLIILLPLSIVISSLIMNSLTIIISIFFLLILIKEKNYEICKNIFFILISFFFIFLLFNLINSINISNSLNRTFGFLRFILLSFAISHVISFKNFKYLKLISISWFFIFLLVSVDLLYEHLFGQNILGFSNQFPGRLSGFLNDELKIGGYYFGFIMLSIATIFHFYQIRIGLFFVIFFLIISILIGERANLIKIVFCIFVFFSITHLFDIKKKIIFLTSVVILIFTVVLNNNEIKNRFGDQFLKYIYKNGIQGYYYASNYGAHYGSAIKIFKENIVFGIGLKNFPIECKKDKYIDKKFVFDLSRCSTHPHQIHLDILTSLGLIGYLILMFGFLLLIIKNIKIYIKSKNLFTLSSLCFLISTLIIPIPSGSFFTSYGATIFWINVGILLAFEKSYKN